MKKALLISLGLLFCMPTAWAEKAPNYWYGHSDNTENINAIQSCLEKPEQTKTCEELRLPAPYVAVNWNHEAQQLTAYWSVVGQRYIDKIIKAHPEDAETINIGQLIWYETTGKDCIVERDTATYEDDDAEGKHMLYYDDVTFNSCIYGATMNRVRELRNKASE